MADQRAGDWVVERADEYGVPFERYLGLFIVSDSNEIMAGVVYDEHDPYHRTIQMSVAVDDPKCLTKNMVGNIFSYAFDGLKVYRVWFQTKHTNERLLKMSEKLGFKREATLKNHFGERHAVVGRMLYPTYRRLYKDEIA